MKLKFSNILFLLLASSLIGIIYNFISPNGISIFNVKADHLNSINNISGIKELNSSKVFSLVSNIDLIFIDARDQWEYSEKRISGAINIPEYSFGNNNTLVKSLDKKMSYIIYCSSDDCNLSHKLAFRLNKLGFNNLIILSDGIEGWIKKNYPTDGV